MYTRRQKTTESLHPTAPPCPQHQTCTHGDKRPQKVQDRCRIY